MKAIFYNTYDASNVLGKTLEDAFEIDVKIKQSTDIRNPILVVQHDEMPNYNYCYIDKFNRYYFIDNIEVTPNKIFNVYLSCDVLETYKDDLLKCSGYISQQTQNINKYYSEDYAVETRKETNVYKSDVTLKDTSTMLLTTIGGV